MAKLLIALVDDGNVEVEDNVQCKDCDSDDGPWEAVVVLNGDPTCSRCLHEVTLVGP